MAAQNVMDLSAGVFKNLTFHGPVAQLIERFVRNSNERFLPNPFTFARQRRHRESRLAVHTHHGPVIPKKGFTCRK